MIITSHKKKTSDNKIDNINNKPKQSSISETLNDLEDKEYLFERDEFIFINAEFLKLFHEIYIEFHKKNHVIESLNREFHTIESRINASSEFHGKILEYNTFISQCLLIFILCSHIYLDLKQKILFVIIHLHDIIHF